MVEQATDKQEQTFGNLINPYTNKPVHTGKSVSFNQNTYDDINYIQAKNNLLKDFNINMTRPQSVNAQALYDIPVIPEFMKEEYQDAYSAGNWLESLNIATPEEIDEWRAMGKMGIGETAQRLKSLKSAKYIPFVGTTAEVGYNLDMLSAVNRLKKGEQISDVERDLLVDYLREIKEIQVRGTTLPSKALTAILESVPYMVEFGVGVAAAPETFGGGLAASGAALTKAAGKKAARKAVAKALQKAAVESTMTGTKKALSMSAAKTLYKNTYDSMLKAGATKAVKEVGMKEAAKIVAKNTPKDMARAAFGSPVLTYMTAKNTVGGVAERQLGGSMQVTDAGEAVFLEPENMALSIMKAFGTSVFDNYTETMGWAFAPVSSYFAKPVRKVLPQKFFTGFEKLVSSRYGMPAAEALKKFGYDGVLEEMGEELLNRFLCQTFGINGLDEYTFDGFMNNVFYANDPEQWLVEAISFAAMGGAAHSAYGISSDVKKRYDEAQNKKIAAKLAELANKRIYSPAEYYLEQGLIKINGSQSEAEKMLREKFEERGVDKNTADDFVNNSSELEIRKQLKQFIDEDEADADKRREKAVNYLADKMLENKSYNNKDMAQKNANLIVTALEKLSETNGIPIEELINNEAPKILNQSMNENVTPEQEKNREIEARLQELEIEFSNMNEENWDDEKFVTLENEYNNLVELKNQGEIVAKNIDKNTLGNVLDTSNMNLKNNDYEYTIETISESEQEGIYSIRAYDNDKEVGHITFYDWKNGTIHIASQNVIDGYKRQGIGTDIIKIVKSITGLNKIDGNVLTEDGKAFLAGLENKGEIKRYYQEAKLAGAENGELLKAAKEWEEKGTESKYFKKWFGDSKVVDKNGNPLVVYHGTNAEFDTFEKGDIGFHFGTMKAASERKSETGNLMPVYLSIQNPLYLENDPYQFDETGDLPAILKDLDLLPDDVLLDSEKVDVEKILENKNMGYGDNPYIDMTNYRKALEKKGYDGIIYKNEYEDKGSYSYIAFSPEQIKSVNNQGTFDANNSNIYYQSAYHGTPHRFDKFSLEYIGTGEGNQAHGWGLYFAGNKDISDEYRQMLEKLEYIYDGVNIDNLISPEYFGKTKMYIRELANGKNILKQAEDDYIRTIKDLEYEKKLYSDTEFRKKENTKLLKQAKKAEKGKTYYEYKLNSEWKDANEKLALIEDVLNYLDYKDVQINTINDRIDMLNNDLKFLKNIRADKLSIEGKGQLFEVDIPDEDVLLDEDKLLKDQPEKVKNAIIKYFQSKPESYISPKTEDDLPSHTGRQFYKEVVFQMKMENNDFDSINKAEKAASLLLNEFGIKGITYDGSRDGRCYVIFDDNAVKILNKYYQFAGEGSLTADKHSLINAQKMIAEGNNPDYVRNLTGWFKGIDGKWKYEISDKDAIVNVDDIKKARQDEIDYINANIDAYNLRMSDLVKEHDNKEISDEDFRERYDNLMERKLDEVDRLNFYREKAYYSTLGKILSHEKLYAAYPSIANTRIEIRPLAATVAGSYSKSKNTIELSAAYLNDTEKLKSILMHEIQHYIQRKEGFANGGNTENIAIILADARDEIKNSKENKAYDNAMKEYSIINNVILAKTLMTKPEHISKSYWWTEKGKGWYAPRKTRKKARKEYIDECCNEFINESIEKHKTNGTIDKYYSYSKKDISELRKTARSLINKADRILRKVDFNRLDKLERAIEDLDNFSASPFSLYERLSGEVEARNTAKRMNMSEDERKENSPSLTADVSSWEQIVIFDDGTTAFAERDMSDAGQGNLFYDNLKARDLRKVKGYYLPAENLIELFKNADESTIIHEFAHWWLDRLVKYSENNEELSEDVAAVRKWVKNDGGEFTREQHEKFARGFETYIRSGYAKNNRLKKLFEDFKNALLSIYDSILQLGFKKEDMPQIQDLFDRLLTTEHERIKATVFDKIAEIDEKIDNIRENEKEEFKELDEIWKDNIAILNRRSDKKRKVEEYIQLAETIPFRETKETREWKQRYKNATLDILATYSGKSRSWVANSRNWEKLQDLIGQANDGISASNGFLQEWAEFYTDTGVSYENSEVGADEELAQQAFDVMVAGDYNHPLDENYEFRDIDAFVSKIDYLAAKIKTVKGEEKNVVFEALTTLFSKMPDMPDDVMAEISKKLIKAGEELEEDTKEDFNRKVYPSIPIVQQLQFYITKKLNDLKVYNPETRYKMRLNKSHRLYKYIQNVNSVNQAKKQIKKINEFIIDDMRNNQRSLLHKEIQKQIRVNSKLVKVGTMTKGKFDWKTNTCFAELVQMNKMDRKDAEKELGAITQIQDAAKSESRDSFDENETGEFNKSNDFQDILKKEFLQYRSMRLQDLDVIHTIQLLQDILELKEQGRKAKSEEDFISRTQKWNTKNNLLDLLEITKQSGAQFGANWIAGVGGAISLNGGTLANWESLLNAVFNKDTAQKYSLLKDEADSDVYARKHMLNFYDRAADIYGFKKPSGFDKFLDYDNMQPLIKLFQEYDNEKYTYMQQVFSINSPDGTARSSIDLSRSQLITMFAWSLNDQLEQRLMTQFGVEQIRDMFENKLSKEDKDLAWALVDTCESMREDINEVFIRTTGLSLPAVQNYFPSKAERVQSDIDMYHDFFVKSTNPSFIKQRKTCNRIPMKPMSPLEILIPHINKTAKYVILSEKVNWLNQIFKDTAIKTKMQEIWGSKNGEKIYQTMINKLAACTFTNYSKGNNLIAGWLDTMSRNYITSSIGFSGKVALGQLLSVVNYAENMPAMTWAKGFKETLKHPVEAFNFMLENCEYLQTRLAGNSQNEVMAILTSEKDKFRTLRNFMTSNVKWGDIIAITLGGKPYVDYLMNEKGMSKEDAFNKFVEDTLRAQQAGTTSSISEWQSAQAKNCLTRMIFAFRNTDIQYERKFWDTLIQAKKGDIDKKEAIKKLFIYKVLNPFMFTSFLQNMSILALFRGIFAGDDDTITTFLKTAVEAIMLGGVNAYGYAGFLTVGLLESLFALFDRDYKHFETTMPVLTDIDHIVQKFTKGDLEFADWVDGIATSSEFFIGVPTSKLVNFVEGAADTIKGNVGVGLSRMAGWGRYTSTKAWTGEPPEKERKKRKKRKK